MFHFTIIFGHMDFLNVFHGAINHNTATYENRSPKRNQEQ